MDCSAAAATLSFGNSTIVGLQLGIVGHGYSDAAMRRLPKDRRMGYEWLGVEYLVFDAERMEMDWVEQKPVCRASL